VRATRASHKPDLILHHLQSILPEYAFRPRETVFYDFQHIFHPLPPNIPLFTLTFYLKSSRSYFRRHPIIRTMAVKTNMSRLASSVVSEDRRPSKRIKVPVMFSESPKDEDEYTQRIVRHPLGVKPSGNAYTSSWNSKCSAGYLARLPDELLMHFLDYLEAKELGELGQTCRFLYAFCHSDELWRSLFVESRPKGFSWKGSWRSTFLNLDSEHCAKIRCETVFSDVLHRPFFCAHAPLRPFSENIPKANEIVRLDNLSEEEFASKWSNQPFILTAPMKQWPILGSWTIESLLKDYGEVSFHAESVDWPLSIYVSYMHNQSDESPLYLFDRSFASKMSLIQNSYAPPSCFGPDLFDCLGPSRPDHRWLIIGPSRSGSTFHKDPNATSAWNAVLSGSKYWIMFPSSPTLPPPPGVIISEDGSEVTSPLSIAEYLLNFHEIARATPGCKEGVCRAGELLHVPSGWFHLVLNLEESIAVTQNFVPPRRLVEVMKFLKDSPDQVSGFREGVTDPYGLFVERMREHHPQLLEEAIQKLERNGSVRTKWETITKIGAEQESEGGFTFGFGDDEDEIP